MAVILRSLPTIALDVAKRAKQKRLLLNLSQNTLAIRSGVSLGSLKKFEHTGEISLKSLLKLALVLDSLKDFDNLFKASDPEQLLSLKDLMQDNERKRGRK